MKHIAITALSKGEPLTRYMAELTKELPSLPPDIQRYVQECGLHDAHFVELHSSPTERSLTLGFIGDCMSDAVPLSFARRFRFTYRGVTSFALQAGKDRRGYPVPETLESVDHDRIARLSPEHIEHRIVFSSGAELNVCFNDFELWFEDFEYVQDC